MRHHTQRKRFLLFLLLSVLWMALIYWKSSEPYQVQDVKPMLHSIISESQLSRFVPHIEFTYDTDFVTYRKPFTLLEFFIRKAAHITEYFVLTILVRQTFASTALALGTSRLLSLLIPVLYACSDEYHQSFVAGRTGHPIDVGVDSIGVLLALLLMWFFHMWRQSRKRRNMRRRYSIR
ncbi:MAG: VanZ family protein [Tumebacillaceae bacterium]